MVDLVLNQKYLILVVALLIILISVTLFLTFEPYEDVSTRPFYLGVEFAYGSQFSQLKALVDQVKSYTNLFVIGSVTLTFNLTALNESCNYIYKAGLSFIVLFTSYYMYKSNGFSSSYTIFNWTRSAQQMYGSKFLGIYRFDEPGGNQLDRGTSQIINDTSLSYAQVAQGYVGNLASIVNYYSHFQNTVANPVVKIFTSDYGLYWFDYQAGYSTVFAEFLGNESRQIPIALDRGAAQSFNKPWGAIITWNNEFPNPETKEQLLSDLSTAYSAGATYDVVFTFPNITGYSYGTLSQEDFEALQDFWMDIHTNPTQFAATPGEAAYVVPADFGFGFRSATDTIWGLFPASNYSYTAKIWSDTQLLLANYSGTLNIIYDDQTIIQPTLNEYSHVFYYNQTIT